jgi:hypothetical protein
MVEELDEEKRRKDELDILRFCFTIKNRSQKNIANCLPNSEFSA